MRLSVIRTVLTVTILTLLAACNRLPNREERSLTLDGAVNNYRKLIRWGYYDEAAKYLRTPDGKPFAADLKNAARYRVTGYNVSNQLLADDGKEARAIAAIDYYELDSGVIHTLHDAQMWWYDEKEKRWYLQSPLPRFGHADDEPAPGAMLPQPPLEKAH